MTRVETTDYKWNVVRHGEPTLPALLLLHGFTGCAAVWDEVAGELEDRFAIVAVDLPGHGETAVRTDSRAYDMDVTATGLVELLEQLNISRTHLWGYSMGGRLALYFALTHPARIDRLVLESASPGINDEVERADRHQRDNALATKIERVGVETFARQWMAQPLFESQQDMSPAKQERGLQLRLANSPTGLAGSLRGMGTGIQPPLYGRLKDLSSPTLIMVGGKDRKFRAIGESMAAAMPTAMMTVIDGVGHAPHWESPRETTIRAGAFLLQTGE